MGYESPSPLSQCPSRCMYAPPTFIEYLLYAGTRVRVRCIPESLNLVTEGHFFWDMGYQTQFNLCFVCLFIFVFVMTRRFNQTIVEEVIFCQQK